MKEIIPNYYISKQGNVISTRYKKGHEIKELTPIMCLLSNKM